MIALTRRYRFAAAHVLRSDAFSDVENERIYGKCANPNGHGHDYGLEVTVTAPLDPSSGRLLEPGALDALVEERVLRRFADRMLNEVEPFDALVPTAENIARVSREALERPVAGLGARLLGVRLHETPRNHFEEGEPT